MKTPARLLALGTLAEVCKNLHSGQIALILLLLRCHSILVIAKVLDQYMAVNNNKQ